MEGVRGSVIKHGNANMHSKHIKVPKEAGFGVGGMELLARLQKSSWYNKHLIPGRW